MRITLLSTMMLAGLAAVGSGLATGCNDETQATGGQGGAASSTTTTAVGGSATGGSGATSQGGSGATSQGGGGASQGGGGGGPTLCGGLECAVGYTCCSDSCVDTGSDLLNCGGCDVECGGATPYCEGSCMAAPCEGDPGCTNDQTCCGNACCDAGTICCYHASGVGAGPECTVPVDGTCPGGCYDCP